MLSAWHTVDCKWKEWSDWGACSKTCEGGVSQRTRGKEDAMYGGRPCTGESVEYKECNAGIDCTREL